MTHQRASPSFTSQSQTAFDENAPEYQQFGSDDQPMGSAQSCRHISAAVTTSREIANLHHFYPPSLNRRMPLRGKCVQKKGHHQGASTACMQGTVVVSFRRSTIVRRGPGSGCCEWLFRHYDSAWSITELEWSLPSIDQRLIQECQA